MEFTLADAELPAHYFTLLQPDSTVYRMNVRSEEKRVVEDRGGIEQTWEVTAAISPGEWIKDMHGCVRIVGNSRLSVHDIQGNIIATTQLRVSAPLMVTAADSISITWAIKVYQRGNSITFGPQHDREEMQ
jgi:hypothetical protein